MASVTTPTHTKSRYSSTHRYLGEEELATVLHELGHAAFWDLKEEAIDEASIDIARALWRMGYRKVAD